MKCSPYPPQWAMKGFVEQPPSPPGDREPPTTLPGYLAASARPPRTAPGVPPAHTSVPTGRCHLQEKETSPRVTLGPVGLGGDTSALGVGKEKGPLHPSFPSL